MWSGVTETRPAQRLARWLGAGRAVMASPVSILPSLPVLLFRSTRFLSWSAMIALLALVFVLSGAAGLMYESIWSRYLSLFVGHSAYAQIIVLVIFLGGMSIGALL